MNHQAIHDALIAKYQDNPPEGYSERHHIMPRCMGGGNEKWNLIRLPARVHFIVHLLLAKIYGGELIHAAWMMSNMNKYSSRKYEWLRIKISKRMSDNNPAFTKVRDMSGRNNPMFGKIGDKSPHFGKHRSAEFKKRISELNLGKLLSQETRDKISLSHMGKRASAETREKMRQSHLKRNMEKNRVG